MPYPCFKCDVELVAGANFCHHCGAPNLLQQPHRRIGMATPREAPVEEEERYRIKKDIQEAASVPTGTRMIQTVLPPLPPARTRPPHKPKNFAERAVATRFWTRPWLWATVCGIAFVTISSSMIADLKERLQGGNDVSKVVIRLQARCPRDSKPQLMEYIERIQKNLPGARSAVDAAVLLDVAAHDLPILTGTCSKVAEALAKPERFQSLVQ